MALGGTLYQDILKDHCSNFQHLGAKNLPVDTLLHSVTLVEDSKLFHLFQQNLLYVNSFHHQTIKTLGNNLKVTARSFDQLIEGIEYAGNKNIIGVQWHPEDLIRSYPSFLALFTWLIEKSNRNQL